MTNPIIPLAFLNPIERILKSFILFVTNPNACSTRQRVFDLMRLFSFCLFVQRLHWIKFHTEEQKQEKVNIFSCLERIKGKDKIRTYIYDVKESYVIILEPQKRKMDYYLLTAYYINEKSEKENIEKKVKRKLNEVL